MFVINILGFLGEVQSTRELDYEARNSFNLTVVVMDRGQPSQTIEHNVILNISDVNDCVPDFGLPMSSLFIQINEELPNGQCYLRC